jgi:hypothetical protein
MTDQTGTTEQAVPQEQTQVQLQLQDLLLSAQVIQLATARGAIKAEEMETIGGLYNRLIAFLQSSGALQPAEPAQTSDSTPTAPATDAQ